jgi:hypothetical protein
MNSNRSTPRRWLRFSLKTLLALVTVLCVWWLGIQMKWIHDRHGAWPWVMEHRAQLGGMEPDESTYFPWTLRLLGEEKHDMWLWFDDCTPEELAEVQRIRPLFPEATMETGHLPKPSDDVAKVFVRIEGKPKDWQRGAAEIVGKNKVDDFMRWFTGYSQPEAEGTTTDPWRNVRDWVGPGEDPSFVAGTVQVVHHDGKRVTIEFNKSAWRVIDPKPRSVAYGLSPGFWKDLGALLGPPQTPASTGP